VGYSARISDSRSLDTGKLRDVRTELNTRVRTLVILAGYRKVQCKKVCNQAKFGERTKILSKHSDPESLDGSPIDSETRKQAIKARETRLTRKQSVPQYSRQFFYWINW
jgi:hypothetical protein